MEKVRFRFGTIARQEMKKRAARLLSATSAVPNHFYMRARNILGDSGESATKDASRIALVSPK